jgi:hypothetical protein
MTTAPAPGAADGTELGKVRAVRIPESPWRQAIDRAGREGTSVAGVIREFVIRYAAGAELGEIMPPTQADTVKLDQVRTHAAAIADLLDLCG